MSFQLASAFEPLSRTHVDLFDSHDHCFVPLDREQEALKVLDTLARDSRSN